MNPFILTLKAYQLSVEIHKHSAYQVVLAENNPFTASIDRVLNKDIFGFLIKPQIPHQCAAENSIVNIINIEPYSEVGLNISSKFSSDKNHITFKSHQEINSFFSIPDNHFDVSFVTTSLVNSTNSFQLDERISKIVDYIKANYFLRDITPKTFTDMVFLSPSRLAAVFKNQTGSSISKYLLWTRLRQAVYLSLSDKNTTLTEVAYETGFYDLSQLNRYMYSMLGVTPKRLKQKSDLIQILDK